jgi:1-acyl-sn-glycerol-3-phosphate acyltransferase
MHKLLGLLYLLIGMPILFGACLVVTLVGWVPWRIKGIRLAQWLCTLFARMLAPIFNLRVRCTNPVLFENFQGFVFGNHSSYADVFVLLTRMPMRFLAAKENLDRPFVGWAGKATGTFPVDRSSARSRAEALLRLGKIEHYPPFCLFPEGGIGTLGELQPFYHGVFKICAENQVPYLLCVIQYEHLDVVGWRDESLATAIWRLVSAPQMQVVNLRPLCVVQPNPQDNARQLAAEAHRAMAQALGYEPKM